jgi:predicted DNA-binding transcriptional regulator YafY
VAPARTERLLNLVICLLSARRYVSREQIRTAVPQYQSSESDEAFERMFERDKDDLREMGIPLETGSNSAWFEDEVGYRIPREAYALPDVTFDAQEMGVLTLAARVWQQASLAGAASQALLKLRASGAEVDEPALSGIEPRVSASEPAFGALYASVTQRRPVTFAYRGAAEDQPRERHLEPWGVLSWHGRWYVVGHDRDRDATRVFRLSRIVGDVRFSGAVGTVDIPDQLDLRAELEILEPGPAVGTATLLLRPGAAHPLRARAQSVQPSPDPEGFDTVEVAYADEESLAGEVSGYGPDAVVVAPAEVRDAARRQLSAVADAHAQASA